MRQRCFWGGGVLDHRGGGPIAERACCTVTTRWPSKRMTAILLPPCASIRQWRCWGCYKCTRTFSVILDVAPPPGSASPRNVSCFLFPYWILLMPRGASSACQHGLGSAYCIFPSKSMLSCVDVTPHVSGFSRLDARWLSPRPKHKVVVLWSCVSISHH
ncbi:hypothetical protein BX600DRAFT_311811 [Xylariales sp. PMI_506]|nr:hypothetical protein BX600DRAFT_311811 [Xylariales sp. PMI_506]